MNEPYGFRPKKRSIFGSFSVTITLIAVTVIAFIFFLFLAFFFRNNLEALYDYTALKPSNIIQGRHLWTFITSIFLHGGFFHLMANMLSLLFIGSFVEKILGARRLLLFYLISGLFAGLFFVATSYLFFIGDVNTYAVGASGALFGLVGLLVLLTPNLPVFVMFIPIPIKMKYAGPGMLVLLWLISLAASLPIGNTAHFGGLVAGVVYGIYLRKRYSKKIKYISRYFS